MPFLHVREIGTCQNSELLGPGELFLRLRGSTMFRLPDSPAPQLTPENRNKLVRIMCTLKIVIKMKKSCLLRGSRSSVGPGGAGGALRRRQVNTVFATPIQWNLECRTLQQEGRGNAPYIIHDHCKGETTNT